MTFRPKSPNERSEPRHALPHMRPRCCLRNFTFFGINIRKTLWLLASFLAEAALQNFFGYKLSGRRAGLEHASGGALVAALLLLVDIAAVDPGLDADDPVGGVRLGETVVDVGAQRVQRQTALEVPLGTGDFIA